MNTNSMLGRSLAALSLTGAVLVAAACGTETEAPAQQVGVNQDAEPTSSGGSYPRWAHKTPPDSRP